MNVSCADLFIPANLNGIVPFASLVDTIKAFLFAKLFYYFASRYNEIYIMASGVCGYLRMCINTFRAQCK